MCVNTGEGDNEGIATPLEVAVAPGSITGVLVMDPIAGLSVACAVRVGGRPVARVGTTAVRAGFVGVSLAAGAGLVVGGGMVGIVWCCGLALTNAI